MMMFTVIALVAFAAAVQASSVPCDVCNVVVSGAVSYIHENEAWTVETLTAELNKLCEALPEDLQTPCSDLVANEVQSVVDALDQVEPRDVCEYLKLCQKETVVVAPIAQLGNQISNDDPRLNAGLAQEEEAQEEEEEEVHALDINCEACEFIVTWMEDFIKQNQDATEKQIVEELEQACAWTGPYETACKMWVEQEVPNLMEYLEDMSPAEACKSAGACTAALEQLTTALKAHENDEVHALAGPSKATCSVCSLATGFVQSWVASHEEVVEEDLMEGLNHICSILPDYRLECHMFVATEVPQVLKFLEDGLDPAEICERLNLCPKKQVVDIQLLQSLVAANKVGALPCQVCEFVVGYIESYIASHPDATVAEIEQALEQVCKVLGSSLATECNAIVESEVPAIVEALQNLPADEVCEKVHLCNQ